MLAGAVVLGCRPSFTGAVFDGPYLPCVFIAHLHGCLMKSVAGPRYAHTMSLFAHRYPSTRARAQAQNSTGTDLNLATRSGMEAVRKGWAIVACGRGEAAGDSLCGGNFDFPILAPSPMSLTNIARPPTDATLTVRIIKSLRFRTEKSLVLHKVDLTSTTVGQLKSAATQGKPSSLGPLSYA